MRGAPRNLSYLRDHPHYGGEHSALSTFHRIIPTGVGNMYPVLRDTSYHTIVKLHM